MTERFLKLPNFNAINASTIEPDVVGFVNTYKDGLESLSKLNTEQLSWSSLVDAEMEWSLALDEYWSPVSHLPIPT